MRIPAHKKNIMVHCLATPKSWAEGKTGVEVFSAVYQWHVTDRGWRDVAYAMIIMPDGELVKGRDTDDDGDVWDETGAGARGWNKDTIHIALVGGHGGTANDDPTEHYTIAQLSSLRTLIDDIKHAAGRELRVMGHNEVANKACPCFNVPDWYEALEPRPYLMSKTVQGALTTSGGGAAIGVGILNSASDLSPMAQSLLVGGLLLLAVGVGYVFYARSTDWFVRGRR